MSILYIIGFILLVIVFRIVLRRASSRFQDSFYKEGQARSHQVVSPFNTISIILPLCVFGVIMILQYSENRWGEVPVLSAGFFLGVAIGYMGAFIKE